jgi:hypothetical protein
MMSKIIIAGAPRSGTLYISAVLRQLGLDIQHEVMGADGMVSWFALLGRYFPRIPPDAIWLHQVRHPLHCISSLGSIMFGNLRDLCEVAGITLPHKLATSTLAERQYRWMRSGESISYRMGVWLWCNRTAAARATRTYRVEQVPEIWDEFCSWLGVEPNDSAVTVPGDVNTRAGMYKSLTWEQLHDADAALCAEVQELGREYGYADLPAVAEISAI